jgi:hypothetical protein
MVIVDKQEVLAEEEKRLRENRDRTKYWGRWGCYLSERQWATGTVSHSKLSLPMLTSHSCSP